eukprot:Pompholyxophrys_sp_v1_NODE_292_length_843_cov_9.116751.p2 type:complete len:130 gc:universal NODE_292_length_843_cov_9.116751:736-347(-)
MDNMPARRARRFLEKRNILSYLCRNVSLLRLKPTHFFCQGIFAPFQNREVSGSNRKIKGDQKFLQCERFQIIHRLPKRTELKFLSLAGKNFCKLADARAKTNHAFGALLGYPLTFRQGNKVDQEVEKLN